MARRNITVSYNMQTVELKPRSKSQGGIKTPYHVTSEIRDAYEIRTKEELANIGMEPLYSYRFLQIT